MPYVGNILIPRKLYVFLAVTVIALQGFACNKSSSPPSATSCGAGTANAPLMIDSGQLITANSANKAGAVLYSETQVTNTNSAYACTATAVSTSTVITAAHCLYSPNDSNTSSGRVYGKQYCVSDFSRKRICSDKIFVDTDYLAKAANIPAELLGQQGLDFGFVVFPDDTFSEYSMVSDDQLKSTDSVIMVGFAPQNPSNSSAGSKRFGWNIVDSLLSWTTQDSSSSADEVLVKTNYGNGFSKVAVNHGDSGGPLFTTDCKIAGVASMRVSASGQGDGSLHTNLTANYVTNRLYNLWMNNGKQGYLCGLIGADTAFCPDIGRYRPLEAAVTQEATAFPCTSLHLSGEQQTAENASEAGSCPAQ